MLSWSSFVALIIPSAMTSQRMIPPTKYHVSKFEKDDWVRLTDVDKDAPDVLGGEEQLESLLHSICCRAAPYIELTGGSAASTKTREARQLTKFAG